tara:strand:+ start:33535 stop:35280 length:1746 start_codon:yes stop_codon:yes gene_type:complete
MIYLRTLSKPFLFLYFFCFGTAMIWGQEEDDLDTEIVTVVKPYTPTISDAFKVKETPVLDDSVTTQKKEVNYSIFSVPVASTFTPAKGKAETVEKAKKIKLYDNYATLGFGNYTTILGELFSNFEISRTDQAGFFFRHNSAQGDIDGIVLENKFYNTSLDGYYNSRQRDLSYRVDAGVSHQLYNWYGLPDEMVPFTAETIAGIDPQQTYLGAQLGGNIAVEDSFFEQLSAKIQYVSDAFSSSEFRITAQPEFQFPLSEFELKVKGEVDYLTGSFERNYANTSELPYGLLIAGVAPAWVYANEDLTVALGAAAVVGVDTERSQSDFFIYPRIQASYRLVDEVLVAYAGADGGLRQNSFYQFKEENPFVSPTLFIAPTNELVDGYVGLKGKLSNAVGYNVRGGYRSQENRALFRLNPYKGSSTAFEGYENGNSFGVVYDDINTFSLFGELQVQVSDDFSLGINAEYQQYNTTNQAEAWNLPELQATVFSNFNITEQIYAGASVFYVGERFDLFQDTTGASGPAVTLTLDGYVDANAHVGYKVNDRLNIFLKGSNLVGGNYEKWANFPVQSIQGLLGATYKFDW